MKGTLAQAELHGDDDARAAVYANRNRLRSGVGKEAMRKRGEMVERSFAHVLERGGMRRTWFRGRENVHERYLVHLAGYNLGVLMRALFGVRHPEGGCSRLECCSSFRSPRRSSWSLPPPVMPRLRRSSSLWRQTLPDQIVTFSSGCYGNFCSISLMARTVLRDDMDRIDAI